MVMVAAGLFGNNWCIIRNSRPFRTILHHLITGWSRTHRAWVLKLHTFSHGKARHTVVGNKPCRHATRVSKLIWIAGVSQVLLFIVLVDYLWLNFTGLLLFPLPLFCSLFVDTSNSAAILAIQTTLVPSILARVVEWLRIAVGGCVILIRGLAIGSPHCTFYGRSLLLIKTQHHDLSTLL